MGRRRASVSDSAKPPWRSSSSYRLPASGGGAQTSASVGSLACLKQTAELSRTRHSLQTMTIPFLGGLQLDHSEMSAEGSNKFQKKEKGKHHFNSSVFRRDCCFNPGPPPRLVTLINRLICEKMKDLTGPPFNNKDFLSVCMIKRLAWKYQQPDAYLFTFTPGQKGKGKLSLIGDLFAQRLSCGCARR